MLKNMSFSALVANRVSQRKTDELQRSPFQQKLWEGVKLSQDSQELCFLNFDIKDNFSSSKEEIRQLAGAKLSRQLGV